MMNKFGCKVAIPALILALFGCGEDSSSATVTVKAIDGYLKNAEVYIDRNEDNIADDDEWIGTTDSEGNLSFPLIADDLPYDRIVRVIAGKTSDSDAGGKVAYTYEMVADSDSSVITPFTTLAKVLDMSTSELAEDLEIDPSLLLGNYIEAKSSDDNYDAKQVHLLARSTVLLFGNNINETILDTDLAINVGKLNEASKTLEELEKCGDIEKLEYFENLDDLEYYENLEDLESLEYLEYLEYIECEVLKEDEGIPEADLIDMNDTIITIITIDEISETQSEDMLLTIDEFMDNKSYYSFSLNSFWLHGCESVCGSGDGLADWIFDYTNMKVTLNGSHYTLNVEDDDSFFITGGDLAPGEPSEMQDQFIYTAEGFGIALSIDNDLQIYSAVDPEDSDLRGFLGEDLSATEFEGKTLYHLSDTKRSTDDDSNKPWISAPEIDTVSVSSIDATNGIITLNDDNEKYYTVIISNRDLYVLRANEDNHPSILFKSEEQARYIGDIWVSSTSETRPSDND